MRGKKSRLFICGMLAACMLIEQIATDTMSLTAYAAADTTVVSDAQGTSEDSGDGSLQVYTEGDSDTPVAEASGESSEQGTAQTETKASDESGSADASSADTGKSEDGAADTSSDAAGKDGTSGDASASTSENAGQSATDGTSKEAANQSKSATGEDDEELTDEEKAAKEKEEKEKKALEEAALKDAEKKTYKASIKVIWDDDGNLYKQRPSSLRISIADQEMELSVSDSDSETTTTVEYTSAEEATEIKLLDSLSDYNTSLDRDSDGTFIIKNTYNGEKKEITIGIKWIDEHNNTVSWPSKVYSNQAKFDLKANDDSRYETVYFSPTGSTIKRSVQKDFDCSNIEVAALDGYSTIVESDNAKENFTVNYIANNRTIDITTSWQNINGHGDRIPERCSFTYGAVEHCISASFDTYDEKGEKKTISLPDGELIEDTFSVDPIPCFESVVTRMDWGYDVEYTYSGEGAISISVKWIDYDDRWNERPDQIGLTFIPGIESEAAVTTSTISAGDNWKNDSLQDKDMPDGWGVEKKIVPQTVYNYTCSYVWFGNNKDTCTITYTHKKIKDGKLKVEWAGDEEHLDLRPSKVKVDLLDDGNIENVIASFTLTGKNEAFLDLPADFTADWIQPENVDYYAPYIYLDEETDTWVIQYQFCAANQHAVDVIWDDFNNVLNTRPDSFRLKMGGNGDSAGYYIVLSKDDAIEENKWHSLIWLTGENIYAFRRPVITDANAAALMGYTSNVTITEDKNYQIELKYEGDKREQIKIQTEWKNAEGMNKPKTLSVRLDKDSTYVQKLEVFVDKEETLYAPEGLSADDITVAEIQSCDEADNYTFETRDDEYNEQGVHVFTIVGTYKTDKVNIGVQKEWIDEGHTGERSDVTVQLYIDDQPQNKYKTLTAKNNWKSAFTGLDQLSNGHEYKVEEVLSDKQEKLYKSSVKGDASSGFTITNTYIEEIPIKVIWEDDDNISGFSNTLSRPSSFNMKINFKKPDGTESSTSVTVKKPDAVEVDSIWECTFTDYDGFVKQYYNSFEVSGIPSWYEVEANYTKQDGFRINCKLKDEYEYKPLEIYTVWEGEDETVGSSQRPANIELTLSTDGRSDSAVIISATERKKDICVSKDVYDNDKITIKASDPQPSDIENAEKYTYYVTRNEKQKQIYTVHCVYSPVKFDVVKKWKDTGHKDERPSSVQVQLYVDDVKQEGDNALITLSADNDWKGTFRLPKLTDGMSYKVKEVIPEKYEENYSSEVTGDADKGFTITNTYVEEADKKTIKITKKWEDIGHEEERPDSVTVRLYDGTSLVKDDIVLSEDNEWTATVKVTDNSASYRVEEVETSTGTDTGTDSGTTDGSETTTPTDTDTNDSAKQSADSTTSTDTGSTDTGSTDQEAAPTPGTGSTDQEAAPTPGTGTTDQDAAPTPGTTTGGNLSKYQVSYSSYTPTTTGTEEGYNEELIITNTYKVEGDDYKDITITKYWDDNDNAAGLRPSSVEIKLQKKVGEQTTATDVCTVTLNADNDWKAVVRDQPLYEGTGDSRQAITYNVLEVGTEDEAPAPTPTPTPTPEEGDTTTGGDTDESGEDKDAAPLSNEGNTNTTAANTAETDTSTDTDTQEPAPTPSGTTTGGTTTGGTTTGDDTTSGGASGGWSTPTIAAYKAFYVGSAEEGFTVINSFNLTDINIKVVWDDAGHEEIRPKQVTDIYLYKGEEQASDKLTVDESVNWAQVVPDQSVEGDFTVKAPDLEHYDRTIIGDALDGFIITYIYRDNSDETADIVIKKKWDMGDLAVALAHPDKATVQLKKGDEVIATQELSADNDWTFTMREQPLKDEKGQEIKYTVEEVGTPSGYEMSVEEVNQDAEGREIKTDGEGAESSGKDTDSQQTAGQTANGDSASAQNGIDGTGTAGAAEGSDTTQTVTTAAVAAKVFTVTNKYNGKTIHYKVEKKWDIDIEDNDRPDSIRVAIQKKNGDKWETVKVPELSKDNSWTWEGNLPDGEYRARELKEDTLFEEFETVIKNAVGTLTKDTYTSWIANIKSSGKSYWSGLPDYLKKAADKGYDYLCDSLNAKADDLYDQMMERLSFASVDGKIVDAGDDVYVDYHVPQRFSAIEGGNQDAHVTHYKVTYEESGNSCTITNEAVLEIDVIKRWIELNGAKAPDSVWVVLMMKPNSKFMDKLPGGVLDYEFPVINPIKGGNNPLALISEFTLGFGSDLLNKISGSILPKLAIAKVSKDDNWKTTFVVSKYTLGIPMEFKGAEVTSEIVRQIVKYFLKIDLPISYNPLDGYISIPTKAIPTILGITDISQITDLSGLVEKAKEKVMSMKLEDFGNLGFDTLLDAWHLMANVINIKFKIDWPDPDPVPNTIQGEKTWDDNDNAAGKRPEQVVVHLYKNGQPAKDENGNEITATISEKSGWRYTFVNCPEMDDQGNRITYTVKEDPVEGYQVTYDGYNITNKYTGVTKEDEYSNIKITKVWDDAGHDKKRPTEVVVTLKGETASGMMISAELELTAENDWSYTAEDMPLVMDGEEFTYTLTEKELSNYTAVISGSAVNGFVITNTYKDQEEETIDIPITKVWDDQGQENKRPSQITATLKKGEGDSAETVASVTLSESNNWKAVVREQPKTDAATSAEIKYTVEESAENDGLKNYDGEVTGSASEGFTITNTYKPGDGKVNVKITKQWEDLGHEDKRPDKVTATLKNGDKEVAAVELTKENNWTATVRSVQLKDILNREIEYTVEEEALENYDTAINGSAQDGFVITNVYDDNDPETIDIPITKVWDDEDNAAGVRPDSVKVTLKNNGKVIATATLNEDNDWTAVVRDQPQKDEQGNAIKYVVSEDNVPGYTHIVSGNAIDGFIVTNSYRTQKILITKEWKGDEDHTESRPDKVEVKLKVNGEEYTTVELNADNSWKATARVPMYDKDGEEIKYTVEEASVKDYKVEYGEAVKTDNGYSFAITNTYEPETKELKITKKWEDEGNTESRPSQIKVNLQANGETVDTITLHSDSASNAAEEGKATVTFGESTDTTWTCTVQDIPVRDGKGKDITYTVEEDKSGDDEEAQKLQKYSTKVEGDAESGFTITNTYDKVDITITKKWEDLGHDSERPSEVIAKLTGNSETKEVRLNAGNNWTDTVKNLPMTTADGSKITYKVEESVTCSNEADTAKLAKYKSAVTGDAQSGFTITNTYDDKDDNTIDILIKKVWEDNDNAAEKRPESVKVTLKKEGAEDVIAEATLSEENNWQVTVKDQPQQDDSGSDIKYVVSEDTTGEWAENYTTKISEVTKADAADGADADKEANENISENADKNAETHYVCTVTNTYDDNQQKITIVKKWEDEGHQDREPEEVVIKLKAGDIIARSIALDKETDWKATYTMPVKDAEGKVITYSIEENPVEDYEATYSGPITLESKDGGDDSHTLTVTNTYKQDTRKIKISKVWKDEGYESKRPAEVKINLKAGDQVVASITLPKGNVTYADGSKSDDSKAKDGDDADPDGAQDADADKEQEAGSEDQNTWTGYIDNLPIRDEEGKEIAYTVEEDKSGESEDKDKLKLEDYQTEVAGDAQNGFTVTNTYEKKIPFHVEKEWDIDLEKNDCPDSIKVALQKKDGENWKTAKVVELTKDGGWKMDVEVPEGTYRARELKEDTVYDSFVETIDKVTKENYGEWINKIKEGGKSYWSSLPESIRSAADKGYDKLCDALGTKGENLREELISKLGASDADAKIIKGEGEECYVDYSVPARVSAVAGEQEAHKTRYKVSYKDEENSCKITNKAILEIDVIKRWIVPEGTELPDHVWLVLMTSPNSKFTDNLPDGMMKIEFPVVNPLKGGMNPLEMILEATIGVGSDLIAKITDGILPKLAVAKVTKDDNWRTTFVVSKYTMGIPMEFKGAEATSEIIRQIVKYFLKFDLPVSVNLLDGYISIPTKAISTIMGIEDVSDILDFSKLAGDALAKAKSLTMEDLKNLGLNTITDVGHLMANVINIKFNIPKRDPDPDPETIRGKKTWDDDNDAAKKRPETITVRLYKNGEPAKDEKGNEITATTSKNADWSYTFTNCPSKDKDGNAITYSVREDPVPEGYEVTYSGYNITNKYTGEKENEDKINITVTKAWDDEGQEDKRPDSIKVKLMADGEMVQELELTKANNWTQKVEDLLLKNNEGKEIKYTVEEVTSAGSLENYEIKITGDASSGFTITNTYKDNKKTINIPIKKVWVDDNNAAGKRPESVKVTLKNVTTGEDVKTVELLKANNWQTTVEKLPQYTEDGKEIEYAVEEETVSGYTAKIDGSAAEGFTVTNEYDASKITIIKEWKGDEEHKDSRPKSVKVTLKADGEDYASFDLSESNSWKMTMHVPTAKEDGTEIKYTAEEVSVKDYETKVGEVQKTEDGYSITITNTYKPETGSIKITKIWKDEGHTDNRPSQIKVKLLKGEEVDQEITLSAENASSEDSTKWSCTLQNKALRDEKGQTIEYTVEEDKTGESEDAQKIQKYGTKVEGDAEKGFTITNTYGEQEITVTKKWDDLGHEKDRPEEIQFKLMANGEFKQNIILTAAEGWTKTVTGLQAADDAGKTIEYTVTEDKEANGDKLKNYKTSEAEGDMEKGFTITNTYDDEDPATINILLKKVWEDDDNAAKVRPDSVKVTLKNKNTGEEVATVDLSEENSWQAVVRDQPAKDDEGKDIEYQVEEVKVENYTTKIGDMEKTEDGYSFTITNTYEAEDKKITIIKKWKGDEESKEQDQEEQGQEDQQQDKQEGQEQEGQESKDKRPESVVVRLKAGDIEFKTLVLDKENNWQASVRVPVKDADGTEYNYTVTEDPVENYETEISEAEKTEEGYTFTITNSYKKETTNIKITKIWKDENDKAKKRPEKVKIDLKANGTVVKSITLPDGTVTDPSTEEKEGAEEAGTDTSKEENNGTGADAGNAADSAALALESDNADEEGDKDAGDKQEGSEGSEGSEETAVTEWTGTIENMPLRDENGELITYTVEEDKNVEAEKIRYYKTEVSGDAQSGFTVTNTYGDKATFHVEKEWKIDLGNTDRPDSIRVAIQKKENDAWKTEQVVVLSSDNDWKLDVEILEGSGEYRAREMQQDNAWDEIVGKIDTLTQDTYASWLSSMKESGKDYWSSLPDAIRNAADQGYSALCDKVGAEGEELRKKMISMLGAKDADSKIVTGEAAKEEGGEDGRYVIYSVPARPTAITGEQEAHQTRYEVKYEDEKNSCKITNEAILEIDVIKRWIVPEGTELPEKVWVALMAKPSSKFTEQLPAGVLDYEFPVINPKTGGQNPVSIISDMALGLSADWLDNLIPNIPKLAIAKITKDDNWKTTFIVSKYTMGVPMEYKGAELTSEVIRQIIKYLSGFDIPISVNILDGYISIPTKAIKTIMGIENVSDILDFSKLTGAALKKAKSLTLDDLKNLGLNTITDVGHLMANVINIKFNIPPGDPTPGTIEGEKTWDDNNNAAGKRPETITVRLYKNGEPAKDAKGNDIVAVTSKDANWKYTFTDLADKDDEGNTITYSVREDPVEYYETTYSGYNITNKYTEKKVNEDKIDITVIKKWDDQGQQDKRPEFIEVTLTADDASVQAQTVKLTRSNDWTYTFKDLPLKNAEGKEIEYKVNEVTVEHYKTEVTGNASSGFTITNTYSNEDPETIDIPVTKVWDDIGHESERPFKITVKLMKDGAEQPLQTVELNQDNGWKTTIYGLPTKEEDDTEITYRLEEDKESLNLQNYDTSITGDMEKGFTITNTYEDNDPKTIDIPIRKVWKDDDNRASSRPESVQVTLINQNTAQEVATVELSESNSWSAVVRDQPQYDDKGDEIKYTVSEISVPGYEVEIAGSATEGFTVTNTKSNQKITVLKKWEGDEQEKRPEKVTVTLKADGELYAMFDLCESNHWKTTMKVPIRNEKGEEIKYTVTEETVNDYVTKISEAEKTDEGYTFTITNTYKKETKNVTITKVWVDEGYDDVRPSQVRIDLKANGTVVKSLHLPEGKIVDADTSKAEETAINLKKEDNQWSGTIKDLPARDEDGKTITYTVEEDKSDTATDAEKIQKYGTEYSGNAESGFTVTNTYDQKDPETIKIPVIKIWDDNDNAADLRPEKVTIEIINKKTEEVVDTIELTKANNAANEWKGLSKELPKTGEDGTTPIEYTAKELTVEGYTTEGPTGDAQIGFTFTNKYDVRKIVIKKVWAGDEDRTDKRPKEVIVRLKANDITARTIVLSEENNWEASYSMPAMGADKTPYTYSVEEDPVEDYKTEVKEESTEDGKTITFTVTNTYEQEKQDIKITKIWKDEGFEADRPSKVKIDLKANDEVVASISLPDGEVTYTKKDDTTEGEDAGKDDTTEGEDTSKKDETAEGEDTAGSNPSTEGTGTGGTEGSDSKEPTEWTGTIQNMPVRDAQGNEISYSVTEDKTVEKDKIEKYTTEYGGDAQSGFTVTNSRSNTFTVEKKWDIDLLGNDRPDSIRVAIQKKEEEDTWKTVKVVELSSDNSWKLDVSVPEGTYRAREMQEDTALDEIIQKIDNVTKQTYGNWITSIKESGKEYWSGLPESIRSAADKGYDELCDAVGAQGEDLRTKMIELLGAAKADSKIVEAGDESYVSYHVPERTTSTEGAHQTKYLVKYEDKDNSCIITNQAILEIDVIKRWLELNGAKKPDKVVVVLLASIDQSKIAGLDTSGIELPGYLNVEVPVVSPIKGGNDIFAVLADYDLGFGSDILNKISLIPKLAVAKVDESCNWRTSYVVSKYTLGLPMKYKGAELTSEIIRQVVKYWIGIDSPVSFSPFGGFISIPTKAIHTYLGIEDLEDLMDLSKLTGKALEKAKTLQLDDFKNFGFDTLKDDWHLMANVINILFKIDIPPGDPDVPPNTVVGKKTWDDNDDAAKKRPSTITVHLYKNGQPALDENGKEITATTSAAGEWRYSFTNCPSKDANGNKITYSIREDKVEWYTTIYDGMNVTNRYRESGGEEEKINITITKKWEDNDNKAKKRPTTITVNLKNGESIVGTVVLSESNNWTDTIKDLPLKDAQGKEIDYKVDEVSVPGYTTTIDGDKTSGFTITNTYEEQVSNPIKIVVITKWVDEGHEDKRPDHVTIGLYADGDKVKGDDQTASQEWTTTYENMPKFKTSTNGRLRAGAIMLTAGADAQSDLIAYSVTEDPVKNYTTVVGSAEEMDYGYRFIIVNTYTEDGGEYVPPTDPTEPDHGEYVPPNDPTEVPPSTPTTPTTVPPTPTTVIPPGGTTQVGSLQVSKVVKGSDEDKAKSFTFTVTLSLNGVPYVGTVGTEGILFDAEGKTTFTLKDGETKLIEGIPAGLTYTVTEEKADGFKVIKTGETGTIENGRVKTAQFTNVHFAGIVTNIVPKTGDTSNMMLWICLIGAAVIVMVLVTVIGRKKDKQNKK